MHAIEVCAHVRRFEVRVDVEQAVLLERDQRRVRFAGYYLADDVDAMIWINEKS